MIGCRKTIPHSGHWYSAAPSASQIVSTMRRVSPVWPNGQATASTGAVADQSAMRLDHPQRIAARRHQLQRAEVVAARGDGLRARQHRGAKVLEDRRVGDVVLLLVAAVGLADVGREIDRLAA